jgi:hypothetical protein
MPEMTSVTVWIRGFDASAWATPGDAVAQAVVASDALRTKN